MKIMLNKKLQELRWLNDFMALRKRAADGFEIVEHETPDFILKSKSKKISVEITALINPKLKQVESLKEKIVQKAREKNGDKWGDHVIVGIGFYEGPIRIKEHEIDLYAVHLSEMVDAVYEKYDIKAATGYQHFQETFTGETVVSISLSPNQRKGNWYTFDSFSFPWIEPSLIIKRVGQKEKNLVKYARDYNENWLVMVADLWYESSSYDFTNMKKQLNFTTGFHQVFIYQVMSNRFIRLK